MVESVMTMPSSCSTATGRVASWNAGAQRILATAPTRSSQSCRFYRARTRARKAQVELEVGGRKAFERRLRVRKDGSTFWANVVVRRWRDDTGKLLGLAQ